MDADAGRNAQASGDDAGDDSLRRFQENASAVLFGGISLLVGGPALALYDGWWLPGQSSGLFPESLAAGAFGVIPLVAGLGLRRRKEWGRKLALVAILGAVACLLGMVVRLLTLLPGLIEMSTYGEWKDTLAILGGGFATPLIVVVWLGWLLAKAMRYFRREDVKAICRHDS